MHKFPGFVDRVWIPFEFQEETCTDHMGRAHMTEEWVWENMKHLKVLPEEMVLKLKNTGYLATRVDSKIRNTT
jgi:hypothetical protein